MHTPWQSQYKPSVMPTETTVQKSASSSSTSSSSNGNAAEDSPSSVVITSSKNGINHHYHPSTSKSILEEIRIMDELPTPFPAYVASAPTATPALKPPGLNYNLNNHNNHNNNIGISSSMIPKSIETVIQQAHVPSASSDKEGGVTDDLVHETSADKDLSPPISPCVSEPSQTQSQGVVDKDANHDNNHADCLAITEPTIIQDPLEAQFLPIDSEVSFFTHCCWCVCSFICLFMRGVSFKIANLFYRRDIYF
ncbi:unnamed protein product [Trichobilharzia regenti]|nr:unnamed protein product [Trichobilharzia regenti]